MQSRVTLKPNVARALMVALETAQHSCSRDAALIQLLLLNVNPCRLVWINPSFLVVTVMKGVVRSAPCAALRLGAPGRREETLRSILRAERLVLQSHVPSLDSASRYRTPPLSSKLTDLTLLARSVNANRRDDEMQTRPKSAGVMVRFHSISFM